MTRDELEFSISQYLDGTLPEAQRPALEARLAEDAEAQAILAEERALTRLLRSEPLPEVRWDGLSSAGTRAPPGLYFLKMDHMGARETRRLVLLR